MTQWANQNGLIVPERITLAKKLEDAQREQTAKGRFFGTQTYSSTTSTGYQKPNDTLPLII